MMINNIFASIPSDLSEETFADLVKTNNVRIERIVSMGQTSPEDFWYDQDEHEFVMVLEGHAIVAFEDREIELKRGDWLNIQAHEKHQVKYTDTQHPTIWLAVFYKNH